MNTTKQILETAKDLLINIGWTQNAFAKNHEGNEVPTNDPNATCFCTLGALTKAQFILGESYGNRRGAENALQIITKDYISNWNDEPGRTKDEVIAKFDEAIAKYEDH